MLYMVSLLHGYNECPGSDPSSLKNLASTFAPENLSMKNIRILDAYIDRSCIMETTEKDHLSTFIIETESPTTAIIELFRPMNVQIRPVLNWQSFQSKIKSSA
jgi:hypothetical protein